MTCKKQVTKIEEKREQAMGTVRMLKNDGKKTMRMIEWQVESAKRMKTRWNRWRVDMTQDSAALHPRHNRETGVIVSLPFRGHSIKKTSRTMACSEL